MKYIPERFNPQHHYFKRPNGEQRHPNAFMPFGFGERKCVGYLFAKTIIPLMVTKIIKTFSFEFEDKKMNEEDSFPKASFFMNHYPPINVKILNDF